MNRPAPPKPAECARRWDPRQTSLPVVIGSGSHPFPFRTRKLSLIPPMVLRGKLRGRVGRCRHYLPRARREASRRALFLYADSQSGAAVSHAVRGLYCSRPLAMLAAARRVGRCRHYLPRARREASRRAVFLYAVVEAGPYELHYAREAAPNAGFELL